MSTKSVGAIMLLIMGLFGCGTNKNAMGDTSKNSLDWIGVYLFSDEAHQKPEIQLTLNENETYKLIVAVFGEEKRNTYLEGKFEWDKKGRIITLDKEIPHLNINKLLVGENRLFSKKSEDEVVLDFLLYFEKIQIDPNLTEKYWKLVSINEREVTKNDFMSKEPHLIFKTEFNRINGNDGCNGFGGVFQLEGNTIKFDKMMSTLMACLESFVYEQFMQLLREELTYKVTEKTLIIQSEKDALKFEVVYLH